MTIPNINTFVEYHKTCGTLSHAFLQRRLPTKSRKNTLPIPRNPTAHRFGFFQDDPMRFHSREDPTVAVDFHKYDTTIQYLRNMVSQKLQEAMIKRKAESSEPDIESQKLKQEPIPLSSEPDIVDINLTQSQLLILNSARKKFLKSFNVLILLKNQFVSCQRKIVELVCHTPEEMDDLEEINDEIQKKIKLVQQIEKFEQSMENLRNSIKTSLQNQDDNEQLLAMMEMEYKVHKMQIDLIDMDQQRKISDYVIRQKDIAISVMEQQLKVRRNILQKFYPPTEDNPYPENFISFRDILKQNRFNRKVINALMNSSQNPSICDLLLIPLPSQQAAKRKLSTIANSVRTVLAVKSNIHNGITRPDTTASCMLNISVPSNNNDESNSSRISGISSERNSFRSIGGRRRGELDIQFGAEHDDFHKLDGKKLTGLMLGECVNQILRGFADMIYLADNDTCA